MRCRWISLERDSAASRNLEQSLREQGFQDLEWCPGVRLQGNGASRERLHAHAVALAHQRALERHLDGEPLLLLEDDVAIEADPNWRLAVPADADAVWVGISRYGGPIVQLINPSLSRIERMFSAHAVLYLSRRYKEHAISCVEQCNACWLPFDIGLAFYQKNFNVYALNQPVFFQANGKGQHDFEALTRGSLLPAEAQAEWADSLVQKRDTTCSEPLTQRCSFVTSLTNADYFPGVYALLKGLRAVGSEHDLLVLIPEAQQHDLAPRLKSWGCHIATAPPITIKDGLNAEGHYWDGTFFKIRAACLTEYQKIIMIDSDMLVRKNIDHLFARPSMTAVAAGKTLRPDWVQLNTGLVVLEPSNSLFQLLLNSVEPAVRCKREGGLPAGDQDVFHQAFPDWPNRHDLHLSENYNTFSFDLDRLCGRQSQSCYEDIFVVHFAGPHKPWHRSPVIDGTEKHNLPPNSEFWRRRSLVEYEQKMAGWDL